MYNPVKIGILSILRIAVIRASLACRVALAICLRGSLPIESTTALSSPGVLMRTGEHCSCQTSG